mgnify:CR=1 FL=1
MTERQAVKLSSLQSSTTDTLLSMGFSADDAARAVRLLYPPLRSTVGAKPWPLCTCCRKSEAEARAWCKGGRDGRAHAGRCGQLSAQGRTWRPERQRQAESYGWQGNFWKGVCGKGRGSIR